MRGEFPALHKEFLEILFVLGIFPFLILLYGIFLIFKEYISFSSYNNVLQGTRTSAFFGLLVILIHSLFDFPMHLPLILFLSATYMGIFRGRKIRDNVLKPRIFFAIPAFFLLPVFFIAWMDYRRLNDSIFLDSSAVEKLGERYYETYKKSGDKNHLYKAFLSFERCVELNSMNYRCLYNLGVISVEMGELDSAVNYLEKSLVINPLNPVAEFLLGEILLQNGDEAGREMILESVKMAPELMKSAEKLLEKK